MSHIDSFKHEIVGLFGGLPVYHPLEDINGDFKCSTKQLVIGGGSGDQPMQTSSGVVIAAQAVKLLAAVFAKRGELTDDLLPLTVGRDALMTGKVAHT